MFKALWGLVCLSLCSILLTALPVSAATAGTESSDDQFSIKLEPAEAEMAVGEVTRFTFNHNALDANNLIVKVKLPRFIVSLRINHDGSLNSIDINIPIGTATGVYKIVVEADNGSIIEETEAKIKVVIKQPRIDTAAIAKQQLEITGIGFTAEPMVMINGVDVSHQLRALAGGYIMLKGNRKRLNLHRGINEVFVTVDGQPSQVFRFNIE